MFRERKDYPRITTPRSTVVWASLNEPDFKYKQEFGEYHVKLRLDPADPAVQETIIGPAEELLEEAYQAKVEELKKQKKGAILKDLHKKEEVLAAEVDRETGDETGYVLLNARMNAGGRRKKDDSVWKAKPDFFNAQGQKLKNPPKIGSGSELKLGVRMTEYFIAKDKEMGIRFELEGVQLLKVVSGGQRSASDYGFGAEDDADTIEDQDYGFEDETDGNNGGGDDGSDY